VDVAVLRATIEFVFDGCLGHCEQQMDAFLRPVGVANDYTFQFHIQIYAGIATAENRFTNFLREADVQFQHVIAPV